MNANEVFKATILEQLKEKLPNHPHTESKFPIEDNIWEETEKSHTWNIEDTLDEAILLKDSSYGYMALFINERLMDVSLGDIVLFGKYVGVSSSYNLPKAQLYKRSLR